MSDAAAILLSPDDNVVVARRNVAAGEAVALAADTIVARVDLPLGHKMARRFIPAGGIGSRLWPLSRAEAPKFLHDLTGSGHSLLRDTWDDREAAPRILICGSLYLMGEVLAVNGTPPR